MTARLLLCALAASAVAVPSGAAAAGPPLPSSASGHAGAVAPGGTERLITRGAGDDTTVTAIRRSDGAVLRSRRISGRWRVSPVTLYGATTGLSADGRTLVLARPERDFPPTATALAVLDARQLTVRRTIELPGFFTVDAISPDGRWLYVVQYQGENVLDYRVRALDTRTGRLAARDVVDPREPDEQMGGLPMTRALSRDGRWAYTLYNGGEETFIHALDTVGRTAACIDLEMIPPDSDLSGAQLHVSADGRRIRVSDRGGLVATVDARTFAVSEAGEAAETRPAAPAAPRRAVVPAPDDSGFPWPVLAGALAGMVSCAALIVRRRARAPLRGGEPIAR
jgi:hypothetical protein